MDTIKPRNDGTPAAVPADVIEVDFGGVSRPKYAVLEGAIRAAIAGGRLPAGTRMPPVRELAWKVGVTPGTVARAYSRLTDDGTLEAAVGRGTFVAGEAGPAPIYREFQGLVVDSTPHGSEGLGPDINLLSPHLPSVGQARLIRQLLREVADDPPSGMMHYPTHDAQRPAREAAARFLSHPDLGPLEADDLILTSGGQHGINLVMQSVLTGRRPVVLVEDLTYPGFRRVAEMLRAEIVPVRTDADGIVPEALREAASSGDVQLLCTSPDVQNPTGATTPAGRRRAIVEIAREAEFQILEDDCYQMLPSGIATYRLIAPERTWHVSSIAKTISPALRIGFAMAPEDRRMRLRRAAEYSSFGMATPMGDLCAKLLVHPDLPALMAETRAAVATYVETARRVLDGHDLVSRPDVSFLWLGLPPGWRASTFCRAAEAAGVRIRAAEEYAAREANAPHAVRLAVNSGLPPARFEDAMVRLRTLLDQPTEGLGV